MDGFHYYNLFETKGAEYLLTIVFFLLLIPFWIMLNRKVSAPVTVAQRDSLFNKLSAIPQEIYLAINHTWVHLLHPAQVRVGLNEVIVNMVGENHLNFFKKDGEHVNKGDLIAQLVNAEKTLNILAPVSGTISALNPKLKLQKMSMGQMSYENNWMVDINPKNWQNEGKSLMQGEEAKNWLTHEINRMRDFFAEQFSVTHQNQPVILQDGGEISPEILSSMPASIWNDFQQAFLNMPTEN
jgi:glycine cleavage system H protein